jgi:two-component system NtrC family response regulator
MSVRAYRFIAADSGDQDTITKVGATDTVVLIEGESGTGKALVATAIHKSSARGKGPFVAINCAGIPADLIESELFGHQQGAHLRGTADSPGLFRLADGGTLFIDELGEMPTELQPKLLRFLQEKVVRPVGGTEAYPVDVRIIAATNQNLETAVQEGRFRQGPLFPAEHRTDRPAAAAADKRRPSRLDHALHTKLNRELGRQVAGVSPDAMAALMTYDFPGNTRELEVIIERAYALGARGEIRLADLPSLISERKTSAASNRNLNLNSLDELERELIVVTLRNHDYDKEKSRPISRHVRAHSLPPPQKTRRQLKAIGGRHPRLLSGYTLHKPREVPDENTRFADGVLCIRHCLDLFS